jgi:rod shape-determining protein MreC
VITLVLFVLSLAGLSGGLEEIVALPLNAVSAVLSDVSAGVNRFGEELGEIGSLRERNAILETQLALLQSELLELREIASDYERLSDLLNYVPTTANQELLTADVIGNEPSGFVRTITINQGARSGIRIGMPVVTDLGLVGRITSVSATTSRVLLATDPNSAIAGRTQTTRAPGSVVGVLAGNMRMELIPLGLEVIQGDLVVTSGLGGNMPPDLVIGQITSVRSFEFELSQEAEVTSLIDFDTLEFVQVILSFTPADSAATSSAGGP